MTLASVESLQALRLQRGAAVQMPQRRVLGTTVSTAQAPRLRGAAAHPPLLLFSLLFAARAAAQVPPLHVQLAPMGLLGVMLASVTLGLLFSLLSAAGAAAQVPPLHVQLAPMGLLGVMMGQ